MRGTSFTIMVPADALAGQYQFRVIAPGCRRLAPWTMERSGDGGGSMKERRSAVRQFGCAAVRRTGEDKRSAVPLFERAELLTAEAQRRRGLGLGVRRFGSSDVRRFGEPKGFSAEGAESAEEERERRSAVRLFGKTELLTAEGQRIGTRRSEVREFGCSAVRGTERVHRGGAEAQRRRGKGVRWFGGASAGCWRLGVTDSERLLVRVHGGAHGEH